MTYPIDADLSLRARNIELSSEEISRYSRHVLLPEIGLIGQKRLKAARVLVIGAGGLGSPACLYLAAAGIGTLGLAEFDAVESSNLQRQILFTERDLGRPKLDAASAQLKALNPHIEIVEHALRVDDTNVSALVSSYDVVLDGTDNLPTRYLIADACALAEKPLVYGAVYRFGGQVSLFYSPHGPCYRCLFPMPPATGGTIASCSEAGVLGVMPGQVGTIQATEALKLILGIGPLLIGRVLTIDARSSQYSEFRLQREPHCPLCGGAPTVTSPQIIRPVCSSPAQQSDESDVPVVTPKAFMDERQANPSLLVIDVRSPGEALICAIPGHNLMPLNTLPSGMNSHSRDTRAIFYCKSGARSAAAVRRCRAAGFTNIASLDGGVLAWTALYAPEQPRY